MDSSQHPSPDPAEFMRHASPGAVIYGFSDDTPPQIDFLIRDTSAAISGITPRSELQVRVGCIQQDDIPVVTVMFGFIAPDCAPALYASFWNYHHPADHPSQDNVFAHMAGEVNELHLKFFGDNGTLEKGLTISHPLKKFFQQTLVQLKDRQPWSEPQFRSAVGEILDTHASPVSLWQALGTSG